MKKIIHVDMDCFYAAVEIRDNPSLRNQPVAVGGKPNSRGVLTTANYIARKFGVKSAMPSSQAVRLCPNLILIPPNFTKYKTESLKIRKIFSRYTSLIEPLSLDEAYLDVSDSPFCSGSATLMAREIRKAIFEETKLTASAGIAPNKFLAKIASDWNKPNGQFTLRPEEVEGFVKDLKLSKIPGVGQVTFRKMQLKGFETCGDLQRLSQMELVKVYGKWGLRLYDFIRGADEREVLTSRKRKSLSVENTFSTDVSELERFRKEFIEIYEEFLVRFKKMSLIDHGLEVSGFVVKLRFTDFKRRTRERASQKVPLAEDALEFAEQAFKEFSLPIRLLGFGVRFKELSGKEQMLMDL